MMTFYDDETSDSVGQYDIPNNVIAAAILADSLHYKIKLAGLQLKRE